jgi:hypothetical protein
MRLPRPFYRLPVRFDVDRLRAEVALFPAEAWARHPNEIAGNFSIRLISADGGENDEVNGVMQSTPHLESSPYLRQVLASFGVVWSRSRLLRLAPRATVPEHADIHYHWFYRVRLHVPILTRSEVRFTCGGESVNMAPGEAWIFDNWRLHHVENLTDTERIHLVADTSGSAAFWQLVAQADAPGTIVHSHRYDPAQPASPLTERTLLRPVMAPAEMELLARDLGSELVAQVDTPDHHARLGRYHALLDGLAHDWRQLYALYGEEPGGWSEFEKLRQRVRDSSRVLGPGLVLRTNRVAAHMVLEGRILRACLSLPVGAVAPVASAPAVAAEPRP